jgi:hypothetical protein
VGALYQYREPAGDWANTIPTAEKPALTDEQRAARLELLAARMLRPDGLDRDTLARIEQLTGEEQ